eukprot:gnl/TRDRNA2_/TRDRNA2_196640_c0_seq1.p1 gnl/TRDRNA2_/TRDRNA2_196640_c0~~gnl/TRDRNA2_/TRDRNA2_196640_c0_seq1.p1  ORF type:complete len:367 (+),score=124.69 gnl/TRDRNA2_/TRDRNA2_196640_c0_seq1:81-1181(+)
MSISTVYDDVVSGVYDPDDDDDDEGDDAFAAKLQAAVKQLGEGARDEAAGEDEAEEEEEDDAALNRVPPEDADAPDELGFQEDGIGEEPAPMEPSEPQVEKANHTKRRGGAKRRRESSDLDEPAAKLRRQIEYYFSDANLRQDEFFHKKISEDTEGWLDAKWLLGCKRVQALGVTTDDEIEKALDGSDLETRRWVPRPAAAPALEASDKPLKWIEDEAAETEAPAAAESEAPPAASEEPASAGTLKVRRLEPLPPLQKSGWLAEKVAERKKEAADEASTQITTSDEVVDGGAAAASDSGKFAVGDEVSFLSGEFQGKVGKVLAIDAADVTVLVDGCDVATVSPIDLKLGGAKSEATREETLRDAFK